MMLFIAIRPIINPFDCQYISFYRYAGFIAHINMAKTHAAGEPAAS